MGDDVGEPVAEEPSVELTETSTMMVEGVVDTVELGVPVASTKLKHGGGGIHNMSREKILKEVEE